MCFASGCADVRGGCHLVDCSIDLFARVIALHNSDWGFLLGAKYTCTLSN